MIVRDQDSSRIGGGTSEYLEQFADRIYNLVVQMFYVHYDERHSGEIRDGSNVESVDLASDDFVTKDGEKIKLRVSVKEGSMIPKDPLSQANQAIDLFGANAMDPITLYEKLDYPDPKKVAEKLYKYNAAPQLLFPEVAQEVQEAQLQQQMQASATQQAINEEGIIGEQAVAPPENNQ